MNSSNEMIDSVRALLRDTILPEIKSDIARTRARQIMATLRDIDWDEAPLALLRENIQLEAIVRTWTDVFVPTGSGEALPHYDAARARNAELRREVAQHFRGMLEAGWTPVHVEVTRLLADCAGQRKQRRRASPSE